ncbi:hypothetical protein Leryth_007010 [Lithospermum erythrorhizon]|nr:hypothetical protein Leryth_007010 [Lithospermum erythrorhizon]
MESFASLPSPSSAFAAYASISASVMLVKTAFNQIIPYKVQDYVYSIMNSFFKNYKNKMTILIEEKDGMMINDLFQDAETYLCTKINPNIGCLKLSKCSKDSTFNVKLGRAEQIIDNHDGVMVVWNFFTDKKSENPSRPGYNDVEKRYFSLVFDKKHKDDVLSSYLPFVVQKAKDIMEKRRVIKLYTYATHPYSHDRLWDFVKLQHPSTFDTLAMDPGLKQKIMDDLDRFLRRREFYRKVGKAWKRGYLLYGPPGTGKSSLIAAIANYLKFDVYDLELSCIHNDSSLRRLLLRTSNRSILVIEDIDCSVKLPGRCGFDPIIGQVDTKKPEQQFTLCGLLNFIDGLWSSCGDERIIIFTTNHKEKLEPALLRPGRMDVHINMSYLTPGGFKVLASNYLDIHEHDHHHHPSQMKEIEELIKKAEVTPAEVAEELMKTDDAHVSLDGVVNFLKRKNIEKIENVGFKEGGECDLPELKKAKIDINSVEMKSDIEDALDQ